MHFQRIQQANGERGLESWGQAPERIQRFKDAADIAIYTPGSNAGLQLTVLKSFDAPPAAMLGDADAMRERITGAASGLLTLMGINADPLLSPEHILISSILDNQWRQSKNVSIADLIGLIQRPPITRVGVLDLDSFMPPADRSKLAMQLNNLLASPAFSTWLEGESLSISKLLYTDSGKPRISILSIAHLSDSERMFFVTILLNELLAWMRTQSGTSSLRAIFLHGRDRGLLSSFGEATHQAADAYAAQASSCIRPGHCFGNSEPCRPGLQRAFQHRHVVLGTIANRTR